MLGLSGPHRLVVLAPAASSEKKNKTKSRQGKKVSFFLAVQEREDRTHKLLFSWSLREEQPKECEAPKPVPSGRMGASSVFPEKVALPEEK